MNPKERRAELAEKKRIAALVEESRKKVLRRMGHYQSASTEYAQKSKQMRNLADEGVAVIGVWPSVSTGKLHPFCDVVHEGNVEILPPDVAATLIELGAVKPA